MVSTSGLNTPLLNTVKQIRENRVTTQAANLDSIQALLKERSFLGTSRASRNAARGQSADLAARGGGNTPGSLAAFIRAIASKESGGSYSATNSIGATGKYQILASNIPSWSKEALGRSITPSEFLNSPKLQEAIAQYKLKSYVSKYGYKGAAKSWFGGEGNHNTNRSDLNAYAQDIIRRMKK